MQFQFLDIPGRVARDIVNLQGAELVRLHEELDKAKAENERLKGRLEAVQNEEFGQLRLSALGLVEMAGNFQATREQLQAAKLESEGLHAQIAELRNELNTALTNKDEASKELSIVLQQQTVSEQQMRALESSSSDKCAQLLSQLQEAYQDRACLEARLEDSEQSMHATMELLNGTESELAETRSTKDLLNETVASLLAELSEQQATSERLKNLHATAAAQQVKLDMLHAAQKDFEETLSKKVSALAAELNLACTQAMRYQSELKAAKERERVLRLALETSAIGVMETEIQSSRNVTLAADPYHDMPAGKTVDEVFTPFSRKTLPFENIAKVLGIRDILVIDQGHFDFIWVKCPVDAYIVKPSHKLSKKGWRANKNKQTNKLVDGKIEIIVRISGAYYYLGTYTVTKPEWLGLDDLKRLSEQEMQTLVSSTWAKKGKYKEVYDSYHKGAIGALKYPVQRAGYNTTLYECLLEISTATASA